jgi:uncharacterized YccA/Bax inhibitor family protein
MRTSNPALKAFVSPEGYAATRPAAATMTIRGTVIASGILTAICAASAVLTWSLLSGGNRGTAIPCLLGGAIGGLICGLVIHFSPRSAPYLAPIYALCEGVFVGVISLIVPLMYNKAPEGLVIQAVLLTFGILFALLMAYGAGLVRLGSTATKVIVVATAGVFVYYAAAFVLSLLGVPVLRLGWDAGPLGIGFSVFVVVLASLNLVLDFQFIEAGVTNRAPRYMEWYGAFGLLVTLVWLYIEALRLLAKLRR